MEIERTIEKIKALNSEMETAFDEGRIDLDRISAALESVIVDLESIRARQEQKDQQLNVEQKISSSIECPERREAFLVEDYR